MGTRLRVAVLVGGEWVVNGSIAIAKLAGLNETIIGLTILGAGTSLPELTTTLTAARKRNFGMAVGDIIGSNIFNFTLIAGVVASMNPIKFTNALLTQLIISSIVALLLLSILFVRKKYVLAKWKGASFLFLYGIYLLYLLTSAGLGK